MDIANKIGENVNEIVSKMPNKNHISGIHCEVTNCSFHDPSCKCSANQIKVGPTYAASNADTICSTFKPKQ